ncbi:MAG: methionyl-tRNA formyltransferase [Bdellovibrionales bacterium]|nr:methionyl-tRNA formyltransferase [Bdellovibrionales bacterium]
MSPHKIVFLGTPDFAVESLAALHSDSRFEIVKVVSQPDRPSGRGHKTIPSEVSSFATDKSLNLSKVETVKSEILLDEIKNLKPIAGVVVAFGQILPQKFLDLFPFGVVNIHGSLLPKWRGAAPIQRALMAGDSEAGVTLQRVVKKLDAGPIIGKRTMKLNGDETADFVYNNLKVLGADLITEEFFRYLQSEIEPTPQDENLVSVAAKIDKNEGLINWSRSALEIVNQYRGLYIWPGVWTHRTFDGKLSRIKLKGLCEIEPTNHLDSGRILKIDESGVSIACGSGALLIREIQPESKPFMKAADYARGYGLKLEEKLGAGE